MSKSRISTAIKRVVFERANGCCEYCRCLAAFSNQPFSIEHILPKIKGGSNDLNNLALSCSGCNGYKYTKTLATDPLTLLSVPLFHPRQSDWQEHFAWGAQFVKIIGLTPTGRATIEALRLNRDELCNLRVALLLLGEHPPI